MTQHIRFSKKAIDISDEEQKLRNMMYLGMSEDEADFLCHLEHGGKTGDAIAVGSTDFSLGPGVSRKELPPKETEKNASRGGKQANKRKK